MQTGAGPIQQEVFGTLAPYLSSHYLICIQEHGHRSRYIRPAG